MRIFLKKIHFYKQKYFGWFDSIDMSKKKLYLPLILYNDSINILLNNFI